MASSNGSVVGKDISNPLEEGLLKKVTDAKVFVVGAGGIGCELLKNLVLTGFQDIVVIDLDTIDVSNLNRQFLFQKRHVNKPKALVAKETVLKLNPNAKIEAKHDTVFNPEYNVHYFKQFDVVLNALDNNAARNHVNRLCLAADVPLVESGSAGYLGQVTVIKKKLTQCHECVPAPRQKTFPGCTIRNTPSELIHCVVWAKYLFNQLFGEEDADQDVSPDSADPEAVEEALNQKSTNQGNEEEKGASEIKRVNTRQWVRDIDYNCEQIFNKLFSADVKYLLSMDKLWKKRKPPVPMLWDSSIDKTIENESEHQKVLLPKDNMQLFFNSIQELKKQVKEQSDGILVWDKDNLAALHFTTSAANIRAHIFGIEEKSIFDIKSMAGNIIPAIATTNAIVAGLIVMQALFVIQKQFAKCRSVYVCKAPNLAKKLLKPCCLDPPNPKCYVCAEKREITLKMNVDTLTVENLKEKILKSHLGMLAPDVEVLDGKGTILLSSDEEDFDPVAMKKTLSNFGIGHGSRLTADDFLQNFDIVITIVHDSDLNSDTMFEVVSQSEPEPSSQSEEQPSDKTAKIVPASDKPTVTEKRKHENGSNGSEVPAKRLKSESEVMEIIE